jgi:ADP-heptose:LPS heptosyltransferase
MKEKLKLILKSLIPLIGLLILKFYKKFPLTVTDKRILIIFGGGIGDVVKRSVICEVVKKYLNDFEVYYLLPYRLKLPYAKEIFYFDYTKAKINPFYFVKLSANFKIFGFSKVIVLLPFWENFLWILGISLDPEILYVPLETPPSYFNKIFNKIISIFFIRSLSRRVKFIKTYSIFDKNWPSNIFPSDVFKHSYFISQTIKDLKPQIEINEIGIIKDIDYKTEIEIDLKTESEFINNFLRRYNLEPEKYAVFGLGSSSEHKNWPVKNFAEVGEYIFKEKNLKIVIVGSDETINKIREFKKIFGGNFINLVNKTNLEKLCLVIKYAKIIISNDTSFIHIGIAFRKPTVCPILNTQLGADSLYGYKEINKWVFIKGKKSIDSIKKISVKSVIDAIEDVLSNKTPGKFKLSYYMD